MLPRAHVTLSLSKGEPGSEPMLRQAQHDTGGGLAITVVTVVTVVTLTLSVCHERRFHCKDLLLYER